MAKPRSRPKKADVKAAADRAAKRSKGEKIVAPVAPIDPPVVKAAETKRSAGRPTAYKPEYAEQVVHLCKLGATDEELARFFGVTVRTLYRWKAQHEAFCQAIKITGAEADQRVERSLYARAVGYNYDAVKIMMHKGVVITEKYREHVPPDTTAMIFWLKNRQPEQWRDVHRQEHTGKDGGPIEHTVTPQPTGEDHLEDITKRYALKAVEVLAPKANGHLNGKANGTKH